MSTFEKICKADHILAWLGEDRYSEVKPLHIKTGTGNIAEWQLLAETIDHIHAKRTSVQTQRRPSKATASISLKKKNYLRMYDEPMSPPSTRKGTKCDSKINKEANWLYAELLQIMCSEEKMSNKIYFTYIYFIVVPCDAVLVETWGCCPSFQLSQKVNPTL